MSLILRPFEVCPRPSASPFREVGESKRGAQTQPMTIEQFSRSGSSIAPLFRKRLSAAIIMAWLIVSLAPARTRCRRFVFCLSVREVPSIRSTSAERRVFPTSGVAGQEVQASWIRPSGTCVLAARAGMRASGSQVKPGVVCSAMSITRLPQAPLTSPPR